ncbi:MAG: carboxypeptidase-like regulatory domain-containing protein, partial [Acidobacteriaceae bacterium]
MKRNRVLAWFCCIGLLFFCTSIAVAQTITGSIRGTVTDPSGAVVAGANVTATNVATGVTSQTVTNHDGLYNFQFLNLGNYTISASASGFTTSSTSPFRLQIDQIANIDVKLTVGSASTTVKVASSAGAILNTENATLGTSISAHALETMPLPGQNPLYATMFVPGALNPTVSSMNSAYRVTSWDQIPSFNGNRQQGNNFVLDGIEINETTENLSGYNPSPQSLQEVRVITGNSDAEYGNVDGAEILYVTKAGTNQFHGSAFEFFENQNFAANTYSNNYNNAAK